jgi:plastocyanin
MVIDEKSSSFFSRHIKTFFWIVFIIIMFVTWYFSKSIEMRGNNSASVFTSSGVVHEISLYKDRAETTMLNIRVGEEVLFVVKDASNHNIAEERKRKTDARLESGEFSEGESYSLVFQNKGSMSFYDRLNQDIRVTVVIE